MDYKVLRFLREVVEEGKLKDITLLFGEEEYLIRTVIDKLKTYYRTSVLWGDELTLDELREEIGGAEMFSEPGKKLCIVYRAEEFIKALGKKGTEGFLKLITSPLGAKLLLVFEGKLSKKELSREPFKTIRSMGDLVVSERLSRERIRDIIKKKFTREGITIEQEAIELLISLTGANLVLLKQESEKLINYAGQKYK
jgi:DNA polymerase-3 subunit delta